KQGERVLIDVAARRIDSRLDATIVLLDPSGRELKKIKEGVGADPVLDFTAPADGKYLLKLYDEIYGGGSDYFYRLTASKAQFIEGCPADCRAVRSRRAVLSRARYGLVRVRCEEGADAMDRGNFEPARTAQRSVSRDLSREER